ncbi:hypothetical protein LCGC14_0136410 [marine sediment metagenome]|uniref:aminodeoxychorismate lyase n=1 Tax=marine sediment metagenome TaxID=412755 RepID=A0A0F9V2R1_9ZZZZ|tara:strand:- start:29490 stop:30335 length:846 start_codon:yes stop_codon:yes gene_type:complete
MTADATMSGATAVTLLNGQAADCLPLSDRGLAYGDGLFETIRVIGGAAPLWSRHLQRLARGCHSLRFDLPAEQLTAEVDLLAQRLVDGVIKLILTRGSGQRGYAMPLPAEPNRILLGSPAPAYPLVNAEQGIRLFACQTRLGHQPALAGLKHLNRLEQVLARSEWQSDDYAEGLVCDLTGQPIECTMSNLFLRIAGVWVTPELTQCGVQGVMRDLLIEASTQQGEPVQVRAVSYRELLDADEIMCCNSLFGVWPVIQLKDRHWPVGPFTRQMQSLAKQVYL